jgi:hypothetical protein
MKNHTINVQDFDDWESISLASSSSAKGTKRLSLLVHPHSQAVHYKVNTKIYHSLGSAIEAYNAIQL